MHRTDSELRIAYVTPYDDAYPSITAHTTLRIAEWCRLGATVEQFVIGGGGRSVRSPLTNIAVDYKDRARLVRQVAAFAPSVVYVRWLAPVPGLLPQLARLSPVVLEIHANDLVETVGESRLRSAYMRLFRGRELRAAAAATFVIGELEESSVFDAVSSARAVFPNGSWASRRDVAPAGKPRVGIAVGSPNAWTGLDRFQRLAQYLRDDATWVVVCPPHVADAVACQVAEPVQIVVAQEEKDYHAELSSWTVGMASLALERKGLRTAAPLKVRDYVGIGLPTVLPFWDEGLSGIEDPLLLKLAGPRDVPNMSIDPMLIKEFLALASGRNLSLQTSHLAAAERIESRRVQFLRQMALIREEGPRGVSGRSNHAR